MSPPSESEDPPSEEDLGMKFLRLAKALGTDFTTAFSLYNLVKAQTRTRLSLEEIIELANRLPPGEKNFEGLATRLAGRRAEEGDLPVPGKNRIEWLTPQPPPVPTPPTAPQPAQDPGGLPRETQGAASPPQSAGPPAPPPRPERRRRLGFGRKKPEPKAPLPKTEPRIDWAGGVQGLPDLATLVGVEDAYEHTLLEPGEKIAFCQYDQVAYHLSTWQFLKAENHGCCCSCGRAGSIIFLTLPGEKPAVKPEPVYTPAWMDPDKQVISLKEVSEYIGRAVVVQDYVHEVYQTKNTGTYFVRFEPRQKQDRVFDGFKVVIFARYQETWAAAGIDPRSYAGQTVRVRGVIQVHPEWGIEILVNSPRVIQVVRPEEGGASDELRS